MSSDCTTSPGGDGKRVRRETKQDVRLKLKSLHSDIEARVRAPASYTVQAVVDAWLAQGLTLRSERTVTLYRDGVADDIVAPPRGAACPPETQTAPAKLASGHGILDDLQHPDAAQIYVRLRDLTQTPLSAAGR